MPSSPKQHSGPARWVFGGLLLLLLWLPIPWGSHRLWANAVFELAVCALWMASALWGLATGKANLLARMQRLWLLQVLWLLWLAWLALQCLPLPVEWLAQTAPANLQAYRDAYAASATPLPSHLPISLAADLSRQGLQLSIAYFGLYLLVLVTATTRKRLRLLAWCIVVSALAQALYGGFMALSGVEYGFLAKKQAYLGSATGSFVNRNHLAGYLELGLAAGIGLLLSQMRSRPAAQTWRQRLIGGLQLLTSDKFRLRVFLAVLVLGLILTRSRMGNLSFYASLTVCGLAYVLLRERRLLAKSLLLFVSLLVVDLWLLGSQFGLEALSARFANAQLHTEIRIPLFHDYLPMLERFRLTGAGLGSFAMVFPAFKSPELPMFIDHAHNDYAQFLIEVGLPGALLLGLLALLTAGHALRVIARRRDRQVNGFAFAGLMGLCSIGLHSAADFNLQIPANAATLVVLMAMTAACSARGRSQGRPSAGEPLGALA